MNPTTRIHLSRHLTLTAYGFLLLALVGNWWINHSGQSALDLLLIAVLPILAFFPWILKGNNRAHIGLGCVLLVYVTKAVLDVAARPALLPALEAAASLLLFFSALYYVHAKHLLKKHSTSDSDN